ncbi:MAG TPA: serine/threonine-protein kinase [Solirubrobacterales bacterium]|nr:serine/threonine-protein kinase [Solirubrobacterales bacterium]
MDSESTARAGEPPEVLAGGRTLGGRYRLERPLGIGGMAAVWLATDERLDRPVAIKALSAEMGENAEFRQRFRHEATVAARLQHPNLVGVYDYYAGTRPYLVMEYIEGGTLAERLAAGEAPPVERLARELLAALRCIHSAGVLHRDVKPQNVLIDGSGRVRLTDFGIAETLEATSITRTGIVVGTETYLAPERRRGEPASERSDLYSLGVVLAQVAQQDGASASTMDLIERLRDEDPANRPSSAAAALAELERASAFVAGEPTVPLATGEIPAPADDPPTDEFPPAGPSESAAPAAESGSRRPLAIAGIAVVLIAAVAAIVLALGDGGDEGGAGNGRAADGSGQETTAQDDAAAQAGGGGGGAAAEEPAETTAPESGQSEPVAETSATDGAALDTQGRTLIEQGRYEEAIPVLEQAVEVLRGSGDELTYNYALFNLGQALRLAGRPDEAIPYLEERLQYPDQEDVVAAELALAREEAGLASEGGGPPPHAEANGQDD